MTQNLDQTTADYRLRPIDPQEMDWMQIQRRAVTTAQIERMTAQRYGFKTLRGALMNTTALQTISRR